MKRIVGVTGTKDGATPIQLENLRRILRNVDVLHHGDCIGFDAEAHFIAKNEFGIYTVCHPPLKSKTRAFTSPNDETRPQYDYITRDHHIVDETPMLIGCSKLMVEIVRSGTWTTIRYARKKKRPILILWPNGQVSFEPSPEPLNESGSLFNEWS